MSDVVPNTMGNRLAPPRFIVFVLLLVVGVPAGHFWLNDWPRGLMAGFDVAALVFLVSCLSLIRVQEGAVMRDHALSNDARRVVLLVLTGIVMAAILAAVTKLVASGGGALPADDKAWIIATLLLAWLFSNSVYAPITPTLLTWSRPATRREGLEFLARASRPMPISPISPLHLGMTFQTSDVTIHDASIRRTVTCHCLAAFIFNIGVLAFTINVLGG